MRPERSPRGCLGAERLVHDVLLDEGGGPWSVPNVGPFSGASSPRPGAWILFPPAGPSFIRPCLRKTLSGHLMNAIVGPWPTPPGPRPHPTARRLARSLAGCAHRLADRGGKPSKRALRSPSVPHSAALHRQTGPVAGGAPSAPAEHIRPASRWRPSPAGQWKGLAEPCPPNPLRTGARCSWRLPAKGRSDGRQVLHLPGSLLTRALTDLNRRSEHRVA